MDSQAKYCALGCGEGGVCRRLRTGVSYQEKIWDHAPGYRRLGVLFLIREGNRSILGWEGRWADNCGVVAAGKDVHSRVLPAVQQAQEDEKAVGVGPLVFTPM